MGRVDGRGDTPRVLGVAGETASGQRLYDADTVILASGGFSHGGLAAPVAGIAVETVFDLPVEFSQSADNWFGARLIGDHPYARFGLKVDAAMRPLGADGGPLYENLHAAGAILAGADRLAEGSREGISLATVYRAVEVLAA
jgi:glycerol-3-phosphate dehydrogenase subunit B